jgi:hypothetical protein
MNDLFTSDSDTNGSEPLDEGGTWLLDLVSAVDHLRRGYRPGFTVWDALTEAVAWIEDETGIDIDEGKSTTTSAVGLAAASGDQQALQRAVRWWVVVMAERYNAGYQWPHPTPRRLVPPRRIR